MNSNNIITLDAITGTHISALSGHTGFVRSIAFSSDGAFLVSGSEDRTVNLWDIQTGGVVKTFIGHTGWVYPVSISLDHTTIASASGDTTIRVWNTRTGECQCVINGHGHRFISVSFSPQNSQLLISASYNNTIQQWNVDGHQIGGTYEGDHVTFSSDGICFVSWRWGGMVATIQNTDSGVAITELQAPSGGFQCCCFSPDDKFMAGSNKYTIYVWDITSTDPCLVDVFVEHTSTITSLTFSSTLISSSYDGSVKFWLISTRLTGPVATELEFTPPTSHPIQFATLQTKDGIAISGDGAGMVEAWDISTGLHRASVCIPAVKPTINDARLINGRLTCTWSDYDSFYIWDPEKIEPQKSRFAYPLPRYTRLSGDGSKVFFLSPWSLHVWCAQTQIFVGAVWFENG